MTKLITTLIFCMSLSMGLAQNTPGEHLSRLVADFGQLNKDTWDYIRQASKGRSAGRIEKRRLELVQTLRTAKYNARQVPTYQGDASLKKAFTNYLDLTYQVINSGYKKIVDMEKVAEDSYDDMEAYLLTKERASNKMDSASNVLMLAQDEFIKKYNIVVREGESRVVRKLNNAGTINKYYNKIYLIFFKSSFYEAEMLRAQSEHKIGDVEQFRQTLESVSAQGREDLKKIAPYKGDNELKAACLETLEFFYGEAVRYMPKQVDFFTKKDKFESLAANMESKKKNAVTQQDVDAYNQALSAYNASIDDFNQTNEYLNKFRSKSINAFNDARDAFYKKYL